MEYFVAKNSIVRKIWSDSDVILFIFAGASAEFALNKAVDWLYFTGKLPANPIGRLFSTVTYAQKIVFSEQKIAVAAIQQITAIHTSVENKRGAQIPNWAYCSVLYMLIDYSIKAYEVLKKPLTYTEKEEVFEVFLAMGIHMNLSDLPSNYQEWELARANQLSEHLIASNFSRDLYQQYHKHLGFIRYHLLKQVQAKICPPKVVELLSLKQQVYFWGALKGYKLLKMLKLSSVTQVILAPAKFKNEFKSLNRLALEV
ncbi:oxygenase MpaB family protein [Pedobacter alpinus]|uniref:Oxygenase MpaB family protein n=1 Tax=Pedobacter alpinus TaxID=1590643 RepID=A0ABW5TP83_9SPHI